MRYELESKAHEEFFVLYLDKKLRLIKKILLSKGGIDALSIEELKEISSVFEEDVYKEISLETCVEKRLTHGAPSAQIMRRQVEDNQNYLNEGDWK